MAEYNTPADYAVQTRKWREYFGIENWLDYSQQVANANVKIEELRTSDLAEYDRFMSDARAWGAREDKYIAEYNEQQAPVMPMSSGCHYDNGDFIALSMSTADGVLQLAMEHAFRTGDVNFGHIISAYSNSKWRYDVMCVTYDANGLAPSVFLGKVTKDAAIEHNVNSEYVANSSTTGLAYRKKGTCKICCAYVGDTNVEASDSPQYDDGTARVPVHYRF